MARAKSLLVLPLLCTAVLAFAETKYVPVESKDSETSQNVVKTADDNVLVLVNGNSVKSLDGIDPNTIESIEVIKDKEQMKQYGKAAEGKDAVIVVKLKDGVEMQKKGAGKLSIKGNNGVVVLKLKDGAETQKESDEKVSIRGNKDNVLFVVDGNIFKSIDDVTVDMIESMTVIKDKKQMKKYGKAAKGKDGVIEVRLKDNSGSQDILELKGKVLSIRTPYDGGNVLILVNGKKVKSIDDVDSEKIESIQVIKDKKQMKKYGKAAKGKDGVIEVELKSENK